MLILPPQMLLYMALAPEAKLTFKEGGPAAEARFEAGVQGMQARAFRDCGIFTSDPLCACCFHSLFGNASPVRVCLRSEVSDDADSVQLLTRNSQVGEFYVLQPPQVEPDKGKHTCGVLLYDEESDRHVRITWMDALRASGAFELAKADDTTPIEGGQTIGNWFIAALKWGAYSMGYTKGVQCSTSGVISEPTTAVTTDAVAFNATISIKPDSFSYENCAAGDGLNKRIVIARPFSARARAPFPTPARPPPPARSRAAAARQSSTSCTRASSPSRAATPARPVRIRLEPRFATAAHTRCSPVGSLRPRGHAALGKHPSQDHRGALYGSLQGGHHQAAKCAAPPLSLRQRRSPAPASAPDVLVMRDVACAGYVAGCNTTFFAEGAKAGTFTLANAAKNMMNRLSFSEGVGARYGSMLSFPANYAQFRSGHLDTAMSVTTRLLPWEVTTATGGTHDSFPGGEEMYKRYMSVLNLRQIHFGEDSTPPRALQPTSDGCARADAWPFACAVKAAENQDFISQGSTNRACTRLKPPPGGAR
jgi:hypothetical protein